jgi:hypothetical protein
LDTTHSSLAVRDNLPAAQRHPVDFETVCLP